MAVFDNKYLLEYAGIPFCLDFGRVIRVGKNYAAGEDLVNLPPRDQQPLDDLVAELDRLMPFRYLNDFGLPPDYPGRGLVGVARCLPYGPLPNPQIRIGDWYYPWGACRWSVFRGLATSTQVKYMLAATGGYRPATFSMKCEPIGAQGFVGAQVDQAVSTIFPTTPSPYHLESSMYLLPPRSLADYGNNFDGLYLVTLVDERYYWQHVTAQLHVTKDSTWNDLIQLLASRLGFVIGEVSIPEFLGYREPEPDSPLWAAEQNAAVLLDAVAFNVGDRIIRQFDGSIKFVHPLESQAIAQDNRGRATLTVRVAGGEIFTSGTTKLLTGSTKTVRNAVMPSSVHVTFPEYIFGDAPVPHSVNTRYHRQRPSTHYEDGLGGAFVVTVPLLSGNKTAFGINPLVRDPYPNSGLVGNGYPATVRTTAKALYSGELNLSGAAAQADPINVSGLRCLAMQLAADYWNWVAVLAYDETYPGTFAWHQEGFHDIIWSYSHAAGGGKTRVMRTQWNSFVQEFQHATPHVSGLTTTDVHPQTNTPRGVGGPSVAQTWRDSYSSGTFGDTLLPITTLAAPVGFLDLFMVFTEVDCFPTQNQWYGRVGNEIVLFEGTSGGLGGINRVDVVYRGVQGTERFSHAAGVAISQVTPNAAYGVNLVTTEKMQWTFPSNITSGGVAGVNLVPQLQTVYTYSASGEIVNGYHRFSGRVVVPNTNTDSYVDKELVWVEELNSRGVASGEYYQGQFVGFSRKIPEADGTTAPVYYVKKDQAGSGGAGSWARPIVETPTADGRYDARLLTVAADGTLTFNLNNPQIWLRESDNALKLFTTDNYHCHQTGNTQGRDVYTTDDFNLSVKDEDSADFTRTMRLEFWDAPAWTVTRPEGEERKTRVVRNLDVYEGSLLKATNTYQVTFDSVDFDLTGGVNQGFCLVATSGFDGCEMIVTDVICTGTNLIVTRKQFCWTHGLLKTVDGSSGGGDETGYQSEQNIVGLGTFIHNLIEAVSRYSAPAALQAWGIGKDAAQMVLAMQSFSW